MEITQGLPFVFKNGFASFRQLQSRLDVGELILSNLLRGLAFLLKHQLRLFVLFSLNLVPSHSVNFNSGPVFQYRHSSRPLNQKANNNGHSAPHEHQSKEQKQTNRLPAGADSEENAQLDI